MTVVATPPSFANINRPAWGSGSNGSINHDEVRGMFAPRKTIQRTNSSSSIASNSSTSSTSSTSTLVSSNGSINGGPVGGGTATPVGDTNGFPITTLRKRPPQKAQWSTNRPADGLSDFVRGGGSGGGGGQMANAGVNGAAAMHQMAPFASGQLSNTSSGVMARSAGESMPPQSQPVLYLVSLNGTFDRKTITVPYHPDTLRIGRQTNKTTTPTTVNGFFDSKVLSRQHAEIWADRQSGKIWIRDIKSSNGTFVNGTRLSAENRESDPHELQTNDQLELGIDIVSEDQKSVVHHKVSARVEHAGFISPSSNLLDMNYGDLDPANSAMMGPQINGMPYYGRPGSQSSQATAGRMAPSANMAVQANGAALSRNLWLTGPSTEAIVKKIHQEMRNAKQQSNDLLRTQEFLKTLLSKDDIRNDPKRDEANGSRPSQIVNGNGLPFTKARFSDPPAPPPQQPLPEKPDVPSLKRGSTERPKSGSYSTASPAKQDALGQVNQLSDALKTAKTEIDTQHLRVRELEDRLQKEQEARKMAEELARRLEEMASTRHMNGSASGLVGQGTMLEEAFEPPPIEFAASPESKALTGPTADGSQATRELHALTNGELAGDSFVLKRRVESMVAEMEGMRKQLDEFRKRAEKAEAERDADRETLTEMVMRIRERDERDAKLAAAAAAADAAAVATVATQSTQTISRSLSRGREGNGMSAFSLRNAAEGSHHTASAANEVKRNTEAQLAAANDKTEALLQNKDSAEAQPTLSRMNTITPASSSLAKTDRAQAVVQAIPYASMVGVVLLGVSLMAYLNGWQPRPSRLDR